MCVQLRIDKFDYTAGIPVWGTPGKFEAELQLYHARKQEFMLAMDVPRALIQLILSWGEQAPGNTKQVY